MRVSGRVVHEALRRMTEAAKPGLTTADLDAVAQGVLDETPGAIPLFKDYPSSTPGVGPFPAVTCISVNEEVVHGIPGGRELVDGDVVSVDFGVRIDGWCGDSATTILVGEVPERTRLLCEITQKALDVAIENMRPGKRWSAIARQMQRVCEEAGMAVIRDFVGHGIGMNLHEEPKVPNFYSHELAMHDIVLSPGLILAVEPMCALGTERVRPTSDGWTIVTDDGSPAAHYEHTIAVTDDGADVLTDGR